MRWFKRAPDNKATLTDFLIMLFVSPVIVFVFSYLLGAAMMWIALPPGKGLPAIELAIWTTITTTFFTWILAFMLYYGPGEAQMREERRQTIRRSMNEYLTRYPDARQEDFMEP